VVVALPAQVETGICTEAVAIVVAVQWTVRMTAVHHVEVQIEIPEAVREELVTGNMQVQAEVLHLLRQEMVVVQAAAVVAPVQVAEDHHPVDLHQADLHLHPGDLRPVPVGKPAVVLVTTARVQRTVLVIKAVLLQEEVAKYYSMGTGIPVPFSVTSKK